MERPFTIRRWGAVGHGQQLTRIGSGEVGSHALDEAGGCAFEVEGRARDEAGGQEHGRKCTQEERMRGDERRGRGRRWEKEKVGEREGGRKRMWLAIMRVIGQIPC